MRLELLLKASMRRRVPGILVVLACVIVLLPLHTRSATSAPNPSAPAIEQTEIAQQPPANLSPAQTQPETNAPTPPPPNQTTNPNPPANPGNGPGLTTPEMEQQQGANPATSAPMEFKNEQPDGPDPDAPKSNPSQNAQSGRRGQPGNAQNQNSAPPQQNSTPAVQPQAPSIPSEPLAPGASSYNYHNDKLSPQTTKKLSAIALFLTSVGILLISNVPDIRLPRKLKSKSVLLRPGPQVSISNT